MRWSINDISIKNVVEDEIVVSNCIGYICNLIIKEEEEEEV